MATASVLFLHTLSESEGVGGEGTAEALLLSLVKGGGERALSFGFPISTDCALANVQYHLQNVQEERDPPSASSTCASHLPLTAALMGRTTNS